MTALPSLPTLRTTRLLLEPLTVAHAETMFATLADPSIYTYLDHGPPPSLAHLQKAYRQLEARRSPEGDELWLNWILRQSDGTVPGYVQATVLPDGRAWVAYVLASRHWGQGLAGEAMRAMLDELRRQGVAGLQASVDARHGSSIRLLERLGFDLADGQAAAAAELDASERLYRREVTAQARWARAEGRGGPAAPPRDPAT